MTSANNGVIIVGAGGHSKVTIDSIRNSRCADGESPYNIFGLLDKDLSRLGESILGVEVVGSDSDEDIRKYLKLGIRKAFIAVGHVGNYQLRWQLYKRFVDYGFEMINIVHKNAVVSEYAILGQGNIILPGAVVNAGVELGNNNILNSGCIVEHDTILGDNVHVAPGAIICGGCLVGDNCLIGAGSTLIQGISIGENTIVGAGSCVIRNVGSNICVAGSPARIIKENSHVGVYNCRSGRES